MTDTPQKPSTSFTAHYCRYGKKDKNNIAEVDVEKNKAGVPTDLMLTWAKPGCSLCGGSGKVRITVKTNLIENLCPCCQKRFNKAHAH